MAENSSSDENGPVDEQPSISYHTPGGFPICHVTHIAGKDFQIIAPNHLPFNNIVPLILICQATNPKALCVLRVITVVHRGDVMILLLPLD